MKTKKNEQKQINNNKIGIILVKARTSIDTL